MANSNGNPRNLRHFPKGTSGNPGGRPRGLSITRLVREELARPSPGDSAVSNAERVAARVVERAAAGDPVFVKLVWEYVDGRPADAMRQSADELIEHLAGELGIDADELRAEYDRLMAGA